MDMRCIKEAGLVYELPESEQNIYDEIMGDQLYRLHKSILRDCRNYFRVIDIGTHCGLATLYFWLAWQDSGLPGAFRADCYEPNQQMFALLRKNAAMNCSGITPINKAVLGERTQASMLVDETWHCCSKLAEPSDGNTIVTASAKDTLEYITHRDVDVLKIDTEGCEVDILRGYEKANALDRFRSIIVEYHTESDRRAIDKMLADHTLYRSVTDDGAYQGVMSYVRNDLA